MGRQRLTSIVSAAWREPAAWVFLIAVLAILLVGGMPDRATGSPLADAPPRDTNGSEAGVEWEAWEWDAHADCNASTDTEKDDAAAGPPVTRPAGRRLAPTPR